MLKQKTNRTLFTWGALAALALSSHADVVVDERFADGNRNGFSPPTSLEWYASHPSGILSATAGSMTLHGAGSDGNAARAVGAQFPIVNMAVGDVLYLTFNFRCNGSLGDGGVAFRAGLFNTNGDFDNHFTEDGGIVQSPEASHRGYCLNLNPKFVASTGISTPTLELVERVGTHRFLTSSDAFERLVKSPPQPSEQGIQPDRSYGGRLRLERKSDRVVFKVEIWSDLMQSLLTYSAEDTDTLVTSFNTVGFSIYDAPNGGGFTDVQLWNVKVATGKAAASHGIVYHDSGTFAGWPANEGAWSWGDEEMLVSFNTVSPWLETPQGDFFHHYPEEARQYTRFARSLNGGLTWTTVSHNHVQPQKYLSAPFDTEIPEIDFSNPNLALKLRGMLLFISDDRGVVWDGPYQLPAVKDEHVRARTSYVTLNSNEALCFMVSSPADPPDRRGRSYVMRVWNDGTLQSELVATIGFDPGETPGAGDHSWSIMPSAVRLSPQHYVVALRKRLTLAGDPDNDEKWTDIHESKDGGATWTCVTQLENYAENPVALVGLGGPKIAAIYGCRAAPRGLRARISRDAGHTWDPEINLRVDALNTDIGYTRVLPRPDGGLTIVYYYCTNSRPAQHIARTIWYP